MKRYKYLFFLVFFAFTIQNNFAQKTKGKPKTGFAAKYDYVGSFNNGLAMVKLKNKWGYIDTTGSIVVPIRYNEVVNFSDGVGRVRIYQKWGLVDTTGKEVIKPTFEWIYDFDNGVAKVKLNGEVYYMNKNGQRVEK